MNNKKIYNYNKYHFLKKSILNNNLLIFLHLDYTDVKKLQSFLSFCKENGFNFTKLNLNFTHNLIKNSLLNSLLIGPSLILIGSTSNIENTFFFEKKFKFITILNYLYKYKSLNKNYVYVNLKKISNISKRLLIPSKYISIYFFKRLIFMFSKVLNKTLLVLFFILNFKCQR